MREIKFRVRWKRKDGEIFTQIFDWADLVAGTIQCCDGEIISRDQYIGIHDKNGKEIWEGDVFAMMVGFAKFEGQDREDWDWEKYIGKITFESGCFWFHGTNRYGAGYADCLWFHHNQKDIEVIGNIYERREDGG